MTDWPTWCPTWDEVLDHQEDDAHGCAAVDDPRPNALAAWCTRPAGHGGDFHIACAGPKKVVKVWLVDSAAVRG